jgi:sugar lactone lactonase YvrE
MMKIKQILCAFVIGAIAPVAIAQQAPGAGGMGLNPATLTEAQIAHTQVPQALYRLAATYKTNGDYERLAWTLQSLTALQPNVGDLKLALATTYAIQGEKTRTYDLLLAMQKEGYAYDLANNPNFVKVADTKVWTYITDNLSAGLKPFGEGKVAFTLPNGDTLFESLAFDPKRQAFLVGSVREGKIYLVDKNGKLADFIAPNAQNGLWSIYAMAADPANDALYVASTASVYFKGFTQVDYGKAGVFKFKLSSGKFEAKYPLAPDTQVTVQTLSSIAVGKNGLVFAADGLRNIIYRLDGGALKPMVENPRLTSLRGLAVSDDGKTLYFADYALGIFGVDLAAGKGFDLQYDPARLALGGIDGLYWYDGALVAIENGMSPHRVIRLRLSADGRKVTRAMPLDAANPAFGLPTYGAIDGDGLYFIANSQKNEYDSYGSPKDASKLVAVKVFRSNLRFAWDGGGIEMPVALAKRAALNTFKPGTGVFKNVEGGSESVTGN